MFLVAPTGRKRKWDIRIRNHDGRVVRIPGDRDRNAAKRLGLKIEVLINAKNNGDSPPKELSVWIDNMPANLALRFTKLGLLDRRRIQRAKTIDNHIDDFQVVVASRKSNSPDHARQQANRVRRVSRELHADCLSDLREDDVLKFLSDHVNALATRHHYVVALKDFSSWMKRDGRAVEDPLVNLKGPGQYENPEIERSPLTVDQFKKLVKHLDKEQKRPRQRVKWMGHDRKMIYWTAVKTGFREGELRSMRCGQVHCELTPAIVSIGADKAKNKTSGDVPIPKDLALALKKYIGKRSPGEALFPFPISNHTIVDALRSDLTEAGIPWELETGEVIDFHALRSTAITWWLTVDRLPAKKVQVLARLKTLAMVDKYSRNYRIDDFGWLDKGPRLVTKKAI